MLVRVGGNSAVAIATFQGPDIESWWGRNFPSPSKPFLGPTQPPLSWITGLFPEGKAPGAWRYPSNPSTVEVKERVQAYIFSPSGRL
jgi:hypothetical protein